jgi:voltage-gated potassium channel Kch
MSAGLAHLLTAVVAVSMAATPLVTAAYDKLVLSRPDARAEPDRLPFDEGDPDVIVAGFVRFGKIAARLLIANKFKVVLLDSSIEAIDAIRRFGWRVHYGDASRIDLLRTAGAEKARLLLIAIDDRDKALEIAEAAKEAFPQLFIVARAFDRPHAFELLARGVDWAERETYESALNFGRHALEGLGFTDRRALKAAIVFREHDNQLFRQQQASYGQGEEQYVSAVRASRETFERLIQAEMARVAEEEESEAADGDGSPTAPRRLEAEDERV